MIVDATRQMRTWEKSIPKADLEVHAAAGYGNPIGLGVHPAALIIDVNQRFLGREPKPILQAIALWPKSSGERGWATLPSIQRLLALSRQARIPVIYTTGQAEAPRGLQAKKSRQAGGASTNAGDLAIVAAVQPGADDLVITKPRASAFFGTVLAAHLIQHHIDTLLVAGCTTSGCVRATVVDAASYGFRIGVVEECVFDRFELSHDVALFDLNSKYGDVIHLSDVECYLQSLPAR